MPNEEPLTPKLTHSGSSARVPNITVYPSGPTCLRNTKYIQFKHSSYRHLLHVHVIQAVNNYFRSKDTKQACYGKKLSCIHKLGVAQESQTSQCIYLFGITCFSKTKPGNVYAVHLSHAMPSPACIIQTFILVFKYQTCKLYFIGEKHELCSPVLYKLHTTRVSAPYLRVSLHPCSK